MSASNRVQRRAVWLASAAVALAMAATPSLAQSRRPYDIPAQPASDGLKALARDSGLQILAPAEDVRGLTTNPVRGEHEPMDALRVMLAGTGLEIVQTGEHAVAVRRSGPGATSSDAAKLVDEVVITGSRIARAGYDTLQAATVVSDQQIERRGYTNVLDALRDTPGFGVPGNGPIQTAQGNLSVAQSFANFFGLGSQRTLTLVNGRRYVSSNSISGSGGAGSPGSQVDLNLIPTGLVKQVETIAIGGAPVYGSDAIAGTINVILKDDFEGMQASLQYGTSEQGDAENWTYRFMGGTNFAGGRGNVVASGEYSKQDGIVLSERFPFRYLTPSGNTNRTDGIPSQMVVGSLRYAPLTEGGLPFRAGFPMPSSYFVNAAGQPVSFGANGDLVPFNLGPVVLASSGIPVFTDGGDGVNPADHFSLLSPTERYMFNVIGHLDVTDHVRVIGEASYSKSTGEKLSDLYQFAAPGILGGPTLNLSVNNPFLSSQARGILAANGVTNTFRLNRNLNDIVDRKPATTDLEVYRFVVGLEGDFAVGDETWTWDVSYNFGRSRNISGFNQINLARFNRAIDAVNTVSGPACAVNANASAADDDPRCVALNLFGVGAASDAAVNYVVDRGEALSRNTMEVATANLSGRLPVGAGNGLAFNLGVEQRKETGWFDPDDILEGGISLLGGGNAFSGVEGEFTTREIYGEVMLPLVTDEMNLPVIKSAEFEGAARYVDHSLAGGDTTWSAGGRLSPRLPGLGDGLTLRGVFTHSIRSPAITELFLGSVGIAGNTADVCAPTRFNIGPNPAVRAANCAAALAAVGAAAPGVFNPTTTAVSAFGTRSGNPDLQNETADSWSAGFVYQPPAIPGLQVAVDYSAIKLEDAISNLTLPQLQSACYDSPGFPNESACGAFSRLTAAQAAAQSGATRVAGDIANGYRTGFFNTASRDFAGVLGSVQYDFGLGRIASSLEGAGTMRLGMKVFWIDKDNVTTLPGSPAVKTAGTLGVPHWVVSGSTGVTWDRLDADLQVVWTSETVGDRLATIEDTPVNNFPSYARADLSVGYQFNDNLKAQISVRNLTDAGVPYSAQVARSFGPYDPIGRSYQLKLSASF